MADRTLPNVGLKGFWLLGEDNWKDDMDRNLLLASVLVQGGVIDAVDDDPAMPSDGEVYIFTAAHPTAPNVIAIRDDGAWVYAAPLKGWLLYNRAGDYYLKFDGTIWVKLFDTDVTLAANSDNFAASQKAVKAYIDAAVVGLLDYKGGIACAGNPNYPAALKGDVYVVSSAGKIGGAAGLIVEIGDMLFAKADAAAGDHATVGASWDILQYNLVSALLAGNNLSDLTDKPLARRNLGLEPPPTPLAGTAYTIATADLGKYQRTTSATTITVTLPTNAADPIPIGSVFAFEQGAAGQINFVAAGGVTLNSRSNAYSSAGQWAVLQVKKVDTNTWTLVGDAA